MKKLSLHAGLYAISLLAICLPGRAQTVKYSTDNLGGGMFQYNLRIDNRAGADPIAGLNVMHGFSVFGLTSASTIVAPTDWAFFEPFPGPPLLDELQYFSSNPMSDAAAGGTLMGFGFISARDPITVKGSDFAFDFVRGSPPYDNFGASVATVPEMPSGVGLAAGLSALLALHRCFRKRT